MLTASVDTATANVFNSRPEYTPGGNDLVNTLQDEDELTGYGDNPTLNVTLGSVNDSAEAFINPILNGIETINIAVTSGDIEGLGLEGATGTKAVNITRITQNQTDLEIENIAESADTLSVSDATRGASVEFNFRDDAGVSLEDELNVNLTNVRLNALHITRTGSLKDQHDTVNLTTSGPVAEVTAFSVFGDDVAATDQVLNLHANALSSTFTTLTAGSVTDMNLHANGETEITSLVAPALRNLSITANSDVDIVGQTTAALRTITIDGDSNVDLDDVQGNTASGLTIDSTELAASGRLMAVLDAVSISSKTVVNTGAGDDVLTSTADIAGTIDAGDGDNTITTAANFAATASVSAGHGDNTVSGLVMAAAGDTIAKLKSTNAVDSAASITLGNGNNTVSVTQMQSAASWENWDTLDANKDDTYVMVGAQIVAGDGDNIVNVRTMAENAVIDLGNGENTVNFSGFGATGATVMAADSTDDDRERVDLSSADAEEDTLGAQVYLGNGGNTVNFNDTVWEGVGEDAGEDAGDVDAVLIGEGALLSAGAGADTLNVNFINDVDVVAHATEDFNEALIQGFEEINLTAQKAGLDGEDTLIENTASVILDVQRVDSELETINMVSLEDVTLVNTGLGDGQESEFYVAGNATYFTLENLREEVEVNLVAQEATGVNGDGELEDDHDVDVFLAVDMADASGENDTFTLNIANSGSFDLDLTVGTSSFPLGEDRDEENAYETENVVINLNTNSHTFYFNDFGDGYENDTSLTINGTAAEKEIVLNNVNANVITVNGAGNVTLEMVDSEGTDYVTSAANAKLLQVTTGTGHDHVHLNAFSMDVEGSFVDLGTGTNTIGVNGLVALAAAGEDSAADALESFSDLDLRGSMNRVELLDSFNIDRAVELDLSGFDTDVKELYLGDLYDSAGEDSQNDFTVKGMSGDVLIQSGDDFELKASGEDVDDAGRLTVEGATSITIEAGVDHGSRSADGNGTWSEKRAGTWADGSFTIVDGFDNSGQVTFNLGVGNAVLTSLNVAADDVAEVHISNNDDSVAFNIGQINMYSYDEDADLNFDANFGTVVNVGNVSLIADEDVDLYFHYSEGAQYSLGVVTVDAGYDATLHFDEDARGGHVGSSLEMVSISMVADEDIEFEINSTTDSTVTILGDSANESTPAAVTLNAGSDIYVNLGVYEDSNVGTTMTFGNIDLTAGDDIDMDVNYNISSTFTFGAIDAVAAGYVDVNFDDNRNSDITIGSLDLTSDNDFVNLGFSDNQLTDDEPVTADMLITVNGDITLQANDSAKFVIENNDDNSIERDLVIDLKGGISLNAANDDAELGVVNNDEATVHLRGAVSVVSSGADDYADLDVVNNDEAIVRFYDTVTVTSSGEDANAYVVIDGNDDSGIRFDDAISIAADDFARLSVSDNDNESTVRLLGGVELTAGGNIDVFVYDNDNASTVVISGITAESTGEDGSIDFAINDNDGSEVRTGDVTLTSNGGNVQLGIYDNDGLFPNFADITVGAVSMAGTSADFDISSNDSASVEVSNVSMVATDGDADFYVHEGYLNDIDIGTVTMRASDDVYFYPATHSGGVASVDIGNIDVRAGAVWNEATAAWVDSTSDRALVNFFLDNVGTVQTIHMQTNGEDGSVIDANINDTPDLHTVSMAGGAIDDRSELEVYGSQGDLDGVFTVDMSDLDSDVQVWTVRNDTGASRDNFLNKAEFDAGTVVRVFIGSGDTEYNVEFVSKDYLYDGSDDGYVSTGERDLTPVTLDKDFELGSTGVNSDGEWGFWSFNLNLNGESYAGSVNVYDTDGDEGFSGPGYNWYLPTLPSGYSISASGNKIYLDGPASGEGEASITTAVYTGGWGSLDGTVNFTTSGTNGTMVSDGLGLEEREIFSFMGGEIGDVVIGGFNPGAWNTVSPINGQITDRLDFSAFASVDSLDDMIFSIEDGGPFANVEIDFVDADLGSITLVGVGEYDNAIALVQGSILFA